MLTLLTLLCGHAFASDWVVSDSNQSPDKKWTMAVFPQEVGLYGIFTF
ncbi:MAG: hypothetical protein MUF13_04725 [Akkermansiaceae bacterium]|jgi:hypothetical protein|nr:hypothetical protein [Akkermansiaceae bacterium]